MIINVIGMSVAHEHALRFGIMRIQPQPQGGQIYATPVILNLQSHTEPSSARYATPRSMSVSTSAIISGIVSVAFG